MMLMAKRLCTLSVLWTLACGAPSQPVRPKPAEGEKVSSQDESDQPSTPEEYFERDCLLCHDSEQGKVPAMTLAAVNPEFAGKALQQVYLQQMPPGGMAIDVDERDALISWFCTQSGRGQDDCKQYTSDRRLAHVSSTVLSWVSKWVGDGKSFILDGFQIMAEVGQTREFLSPNYLLWGTALAIENCSSQQEPACLEDHFDILLDEPTAPKGYQP